MSIGKMLSKKIILTGPENSGKSTIKLVFFEKKNPRELLSNPLKSTKGVCTSAFNFFTNMSLGVQDLAGQQNEYWYAEGNQVFVHSNIIICVFDRTSTVIDIQSFIERVLSLKDTLNISECKLVIFIHKIDEETPSLISYRLKRLRDFVSEFEEDISIYPTSITREHFFQTFCIIMDILYSIFKKELDNKEIEENNEMSDLEFEIKIISNYKTFSIKSLSEQLDITKDKVKYHIERLDKLGFIDNFANLNIYNLNERAEFFKEGFLKRERSKSFKQKSLEILYYFLHLNKISLNKSGGEK